jgi:transposase
MMLVPESQIRIWLYAEPTDMRKSYNGLSALVRMKLGEDPTAGQLFAFVNRRRTQMKVLYFDRTGYCIWGKRLEQGTFHAGRSVGPKRRLSWTDLKLIVEGVDIETARRHKRFRLPRTRSDM